MRLILVAPLFAAMLLPGFAFAQDPAPADCRALVKTIPEFERRADTRIEDVPGGCRATNVTVRIGEYLRYSADEITLLVPDLLASWPSGAPFPQAELTVTGADLATNIDSPLQSYIMGLQSVPFDLHLAYRWDSVAQTLDMADFSLDVPGRGRIAASGRLTGVPTMAVTSDNITDFTGALDQLAITLDLPRISPSFPNMFTSFVAVPLLSLLPYDQDPVPLIATYQKAITAAIEGLPTEAISPDSKAVLAKFIAAFPRPEGNYTVALSASPALSLADFDVTDIGQLAGLLARLTLRASVAPATN